MGFPLDSITRIGLASDFALSDVFNTIILSMVNPIPAHAKPRGSRVCIAPKKLSLN